MRTYLRVLSTVVLTVSLAQAQPGIETICPSSGNDTPAGSVRRRLTHSLMKRFGFDIGRMDSNWSQLTCGMSIAEADSLVGLGYDPALLRSQSRSKTVILELGGRKLVFYGDRLIRVRGPTRIKLASTADTNEEEAELGGSILKVWPDLKDPFGASKRPLDNNMEMLLGTSGGSAAYVVRSLVEGEPLTMAPGTYGGLKLAGRGGRPPKVNPKTGAILNGEPDPTFYAVLGVGSRLELPDD